MRFRKPSLAIYLVAFVGSTQAADWSDSYIGYRYGAKFSDPYEGDAIPKNILNLSYVGGYAYGTNFFNIDLLKSNNADPAASNPSQGAAEAYVVYRNTVEASKVFSREFKSGIIKDIGATAGFDWNTKNNAYASMKQMVGVGPTIMFDVPGFLNLSVLQLWESNAPNTCFYANNSPSYACNSSNAKPNGRYLYSPHPALEVTWGIPFSLGSARFKFKGYANYIAAKGNLESGNSSAPETHIDAAIMYDVSTWLGVKQDSFQVGIEYEYWMNKFGNYNSGGAGNPALSSPTKNSPNGAFARTPMIRAEYHF